jgi:uncharacterized membrane protein
MIVLQTNSTSDWAMFLGHFHPLVVHLPIGMLIMAAILEWLSRKKIYRHFSQPLLLFFLLAHLPLCYHVFLAIYFPPLASTTKIRSFGINGWE